MESVITYQAQAKWINVSSGISRRVLSYTNEMMVVEVMFEKDAVSTPHTHPHIQSTYVLSGAFRFNIEGEDVVVREGDTITFVANAPHGTECLEAGTLVDVFAPARQDFL